MNESTSNLRYRDAGKQRHVSLLSRQVHPKPDESNVSFFLGSSGSSLSPTVTKTRPQEMTFKYDINQVMN